MRALNVSMLGCLMLSVGAVQASSSRSSLHLSMTIVSPCNISGSGGGAKVHCPADVPWLIASPTATAALATADAGISLLPVPLDASADGIPVTTVVF